MVLGYFLKKNAPFSQILGPRILLQIYPLVNDIMDKRGVIFSLALHPPGVSAAPDTGKRGRFCNTIVALVHTFKAINEWTQKKFSQPVNQNKYSNISHLSHKSHLRVVRTKGGFQEKCA